MKSKIMAGVGIAASTLVMLSGLASADNFIADGDGVTTINNAGLPMGQVCATDGEDGYNGGNGQPVRLYLEKSGNSVNNPTTGWGNDTVVSLAHTETHGSIEVTMPTPSSITTPANWVTAGTVAGPAVATVRVESETLGALPNTAPPGDNNRKINFTASGDNNSDPALPLNKNKDVEVTATIVNDASATTVDCKLPTIDIDFPVEGGEYVLDSTHAADYSCDDPAGAQFAASGIKTTGGCVGPVTDGADIDTSSLGAKTFTVVATDNAGNTTSSTVNYTVIEDSSTPVTYTASFSQPLDGSGVLNKGKLGRVVPVKVAITASDSSAVNGPVYWGSSRVPCSAGTGSDVVESYAAGSSNLGNTFRPADGGWIYNLDTGKLSGAAANVCYRIDVYVGGTVDGQGIASGGSPATNGSVLIQLTK